MTMQDAESIRSLAEMTARASYLAYEVFVVGGKLLPTGRTLPIVAESRVDAGSQLRAELRAWGERPLGTGHGPTVFWLGNSRYWLVDRADAFPNAPADIDGLWLHWRRRMVERWERL
jgi:hypothetical protein